MMILKNVCRNYAYYFVGNFLQNSCQLSVINRNACIESTKFYCEKFTARELRILLNLHNQLMFYCVVCNFNIAFYIEFFKYSGSVGADCLNAEAQFCGNLR